MLENSRIIITKVENRTNSLITIYLTHKQVGKGQLSSHIIQGSTYIYAILRIRWKISSLLSYIINYDTSVNSKWTCSPRYEEKFSFLNIVVLRPLDCNIVHHRPKLCRKPTDITFLQKKSGFSNLLCFKDYRGTKMITL